MAQNNTTTPGILVAVDGSAESDAAVRWTAHEAVMCKAPVTLMHVIAPMVVSWPIGDYQGSIMEWQEENAQEVLEQAQKTLHATAGEAEVPIVHTEVVKAPVVPTLLEAAQKAQMLVVGSRGMGAMGRAMLGSVSAGVIHHAHGPVVVVHADHAQAPDTTSPVVLGVDGSPASEAATKLAFDEASRRGVDLCGGARVERRRGVSRSWHGLAPV